MPNDTPLEHVEQTCLFRWAAYNRAALPELQLLYAVPNGGYRNKATAARMKAQGVKAGVPDMFLPVPRGTYHGLYIELKRRKGGTVSAEQREWLTNLRAQGYAAYVCHGWEEAAHTIMDYMREGSSHV